jgi:hypothetical protein
MSATAIVIGLVASAIEISWLAWVTHGLLTLDGRIRRIVREEMDAETIWLSGPHEGSTTERRDRMSQDRGRAILRGHREGF